MIWLAVECRSTEIDFDQDIRPLLSDACFQCHGPDENSREADLRLDVRESLFADREIATVVPGSPDESELFQRITSDDPETRMPPPDSGKELTEKDKDRIRQWIAGGAEWETHWAFVTPIKPTPPNVDGATVYNDIDRFIIQRVQEANLETTPEADRVTLIRRLYFDLIGLPPSPDQVDAFVADESPRAYEDLVDSLLASPHFGERMAMYWLDVVRYADSNGYHSDEPRKIAPYRDYVINAFNSNKPFDLFVTEQLAGDLMPGNDHEPKVASGFNMLLQTTSEGGAQAKEYLAKYSADRVRNTASIFLGVTLGCAECHDHKFDPFTARDFYSFAAYFADITEKGVGNPTAYPVVDADAEKTLNQFDQRIAQLEASLAQQTDEMREQQSAWEEQILRSLQRQPELSRWNVLGPFDNTTFESAFRQHPLDPGNVQTDMEVEGRFWTEKPEYVDATVHALTGENQSTFLYREITVSEEQDATIWLGSDDGIVVWLNGKSVFENRVTRGVAPKQDSVQVHLKQGVNPLLMKIVNAGGGAGFYFSLQGNDIAPEFAAALAIDFDERDADQRQVVTSKFQAHTPELNRIRKEIKQTKAERDGFHNALPKTLMTVSTNPRTIRILPRGNWLDDSGEEVEPRVPEFLGQFGQEFDSQRRPTRLDLANWIVHEDNPLTARTFVNRLWKLFFGQGLATPLDDLGAQGTRPTHPELLDYLATEFIDKNWDVQWIVKELVMSATYRQGSVATKRAIQIDPYNRLYSRQSRWRLDAEMVRDNALAISGLLSRKIGGESVKPYQPAGYWRHMNFPVRRWSHEKNDNLYRRGLYTWWQRMFLHPSMLAFDAPSREECTVDRPRSNTPQQALVLLNDPTYVEAARAFAERVSIETSLSPDEQVAWLFRQAVSRTPTSQEVNVIRQVYEKHLQDFAADKDSARSFLSVGERPVLDDVPVERLAALTSVARIVLNLHETISRP